MTTTDSVSHASYDSLLAELDNFRTGVASLIGRLAAQEQEIAGLKKRISELEAGTGAAVDQGSSRITDTQGVTAPASLGTADSRIGPLVQPNAASGPSASDHVLQFGPSGIHVQALSPRLVTPRRNDGAPTSPPAQRESEPEVDENAIGYSNERSMQVE